MSNDKYVWFFILFSPDFHERNKRKSSKRKKLTK